MLAPEAVVTADAVIPAGAGVRLGIEPVDLAGGGEEVPAFLFPVEQPQVLRAFGFRRLLGFFSSTLRRPIISAATSAAGLP